MSQAYQLLQLETVAAYHLNPVITSARWGECIASLDPSLNSFFLQ